MTPAVNDATGLAVVPADVGRVSVHWRVKRDDLEHLRSAFPPEADPTVVIRLIRLTRPGEGEVVAREPLSDAALSQDGRIWLDLIADGLPVRAELGLEAPDGGWLLLSRSDTVIPPGNAPTTVDSVSPALELPEPEPALAATGADLKPEFPEIEVTAARQSPVPDTRLAASSAYDVPRSAGPVLESVDLDYREEVSAIDIDLADPSVRPDGRVVPGVAIGDRGESRAWPIERVSGEQSTTERDRDTVDRGAQRQRSSSDAVIAPRYGGGGDDPELYTELLVHGRARPGSEINLFGHLLQVGSGGRFSLRLPVANSELLKQALDQGLPLAVRDRNEA